MRYFLLLLVFNFLHIEEGIAHSYIDDCLQKFVMHALTESIQPYGEDVSEAGGVIMKTTGEVIANVAVEVNDGFVVEKPDANNQPIPSCISRAVLYLTMVDSLGDGYVVNTGDGRYIDNSGYMVTDTNAKYGGFGSITLKRACDVSNVGIAMALEAFNRNFSSYRKLLQTGILGAAYEDCEDSIAVPSGYWPIDHMGVTSMIQQTAWINMLANQGQFFLRLDQQDSAAPIYEIMNKGAVSSLASAMLEAVENGSCRQFVPNVGIKIAGLSNVSDEDINGFCTSFAGAFFPAQSPRFTVAIYVKKTKPVGRIIAGNILRTVIDYMVKNQLNIIDEEQAPQQKYHPAAR